MKFKLSSIAILISALKCVLLAAAQPGLAQTDLNAQLRQALCAQNWGQALQVLDQMKRAAGPGYTSQINLYRARVQALARQNVKLSKLMDNCSAPPPPSSAPANNPAPPAPNMNMPPTPNMNMPPTPNMNMPPTPNMNMPPAPNMNMPPTPIPNLPPSPIPNLPPPPPL